MQSGALDDVAKAEVAKIFGEINQLRNQQFQISLAAITLTAGGAALIFREHPGVSIGWYRYVTAVALLAILGRLFLWLQVLARMIARLSTYVEVRFASKFEAQHAAFDDTAGVPRSHQASQRQTMSSVFFVLGAFITAVPFLSMLLGANIEPKRGAVALGCGFLMYAGALQVLGSASARVSRAELLSLWKDVVERRTLAATKEDARSEIDPSSMPRL